MYALGMAVALAAALVLEVTGHGRAVSGLFTVAGLVFLALGIAFPHGMRFRKPPDRRSDVSEHPHFGRTKHGLAVHLRTVDHLPVHSAYARLNKAVALKITGWVGSMSCAWIFCLLALVSLPAVLTQAFHLHAFPSWLISVGLIALVAWIAQTFLQLVLLSIILVGSNVQAEASDARAAKTFEDCERLLDRLDEHTDGGIKAVLDAVSALATQMPGPKAAPAKRLATRADKSNGGSGT